MQVHAHTYTHTHKQARMTSHVQSHQKLRARTCLAQARTRIRAQACWNGRSSTSAYLCCRKCKHAHTQTPSHPHPHTNACARGGGGGGAIANSRSLSQSMARISTRRRACCATVGRLQAVGALGATPRCCRRLRLCKPACLHAVHPHEEPVSPQGAVGCHVSKVLGVSGCGAGALS